MDAEEALEEATQQVTSSHLLSGIGFGEKQWYQNIQEDANRSLLLSPDHGQLFPSILLFPQTARSYIILEFFIAEFKKEEFLLFSSSNSDFV
ncbi:MAG: hypothetical protein Q7W54_17190 [Bacteroidota bacterium]|nr:hypothetical protein [Bacteroidota bacterium]